MKTNRTELSLMTPAMSMTLSELTLRIFRFELFFFT